MNHHSEAFVGTDGRPNSGEPAERDGWGHRGARQCRESQGDPAQLSGEHKPSGTNDRGQRPGLDTMIKW